MQRSERFLYLAVQKHPWSDLKKKHWEQGCTGLELHRSMRERTLPQSQLPMEEVLFFFFFSFFVFLMITWFLWQTCPCISIQQTDKSFTFLGIYETTFKADWEQILVSSATPQKSRMKSLIQWTAAFLMRISFWDSTKDLKVLNGQNLTKIINPYTTSA